MGTTEGKGPYFHQPLRQGDRRDFMVGYFPGPDGKAVLDSENVFMFIVPKVFSNKTKVDLAFRSLGAEFRKYISLRGKTDGLKDYVDEHLLPEEGERFGLGFNRQYGQILVGFRTREGLPLVGPEDVTLVTHYMKKADQPKCKIAATGGLRIYRGELLNGADIGGLSVAQLETLKDSTRQGLEAMHFGTLDESDWTIRPYGEAA